MTRRLVSFYFGLSILFGMGLNSVSAEQSSANQIDIMLATIPPLVMQDNEGKSGLLWDIAGVIAERLKEQPDDNVSATRIILPWSRAYNEMTTAPNKIILQMARTETRENLFQWIDTTSVLSFAFVTTSLPQINSFKDAKPLNSIAVYRGSRLEKYLRANGFAWYASVQEALWLHKKRVEDTACVRKSHETRRYNGPPES